MEHRIKGPLLFALLFALAPHLQRLPLWITVWCLAFSGAAWVIESKKAGEVPRWLRSALALTGLFLTAAYYRRYSVDASVSLLIVAAVLTPLEAKSRRDYMGITAITSLIICTALLYSQTLLMTLYLAAAVFAAICALLFVVSPALALPSACRFTFRLMLQSLPLAAVLFFVFPRISGSLWGILTSPSLYSGFSDSFSPGDVEKLVRDGSPAFRAVFEEGIPARSELYWRGIVFYHFDGRTWSRGTESRVTLNSSRGGKAVYYTVSLEPHFQRWMFALDRPVSSGYARSHLLPDGVLVANTPITQRLSYKAESVLHAVDTSVRPPAELTLKLPPDLNPKTEALTSRWLSQKLSPRQIIDSALKFISTGGFKYTLSPPRLGKNSIDDFLFKTRAGYCEHYASAFAVMMRLSGIPARIAGGYLGGEINPLGNYLIVRQSDAHVWVEVWLKDSGWIRIDPTVAAAPSRIEDGLEAALAGEGLPFFLSESRMGSFAFKYWKKALLGWDFINVRWNNWMLDYSRRSQHRILSRFGINVSSLKGILSMIAVIGLALAVAVLAAFLFTLRSGNLRSDRVKRAYELFLKKLARLGYRKPPCLGPVDCCREVSSRFPQFKENAAEVTHLYVKLRYCPAGDSEYVLSRLEEKVRRFGRHQKRSTSAFQARI